MQVSGGSMSTKVRVYDVAKQLNLDPKAVVGLFQAVGINEVRNHMSSVEPEAVERVKRHLEKQKTHDVVEERVRPGVVKRRAVAKPGAEPPPSVPRSVPGPLDDDARRSAPSSVPSSHGARLAPPSSPLIEQNGHARARAEEIARERES